MSREAIKTATGRTIGYIEEKSNGDLRAVAASGKHLGTYEPKRNRTVLPSGKAYGTGNLLSALIKEEAQQ